MFGAGKPLRGRLRVRRDLIVTPGDEGVVVKDPLSLEYFRLGDREGFLLEELRRPLSLAELTQRFRRRFPNERATAQQVMSFCWSLAECSLLLVDGVNVAGEKRSKANPQGLGWRSWLSPLAIRLPGIDPSGLLKRIDWLGRLIYSQVFAAVLLVAAVAVAIGWLSAVQEVATELSRLIQLFQPHHAAAAILAVVIAKTWHELGHALACRRMGAECHEVGVMLLAFLPVLYCDVSDAWTLRDRRRRLLVALGGVYSEAILGVAAAAAWLVLAPGPLRVLAMYLVVTTMVSTLLVNLNPLMRFDGYYVLADLWGVPNLHQQSRQALWGGLRRWVRVEPNTEETTDTPQWLLAGYGLASTTYGWCLLAVILWAIYLGLEAAGFAAAGDALVLLSLAGVGVAGVRSVGTLIPRGPGVAKWKSLLRLSVVAVAAIATSWGVLVIPLEQSLRSPCRLESSRSAEVVARRDGLLAPAKRYGEVVQAGDVLAVQADPSSELRRLELVEREATLSAELEGLETRAQQDAALLAEIARLRPTLVEVRRQLRTHETLTESLTLRAPFDGQVLPPAKRVDSPTDRDALPTWSGRPLDSHNAGCLLASGEVLCRVAGEGLRAVVLLDEHDSGLLNPGDLARIALDRAPGETLTGRVERIALATADEQLAAAERGLEEGLRSPLERGSDYRVTVRLDRATAPCQPGAIGTARLVTGEETLGGRCLRWLRRLVRFR